MKAYWYSIIPILFVIRILFQGFYLVSKTQFDPDEYWQTLEPAYCIVFAGVDSTSYRNGHTRNCAYTWEWTRRRSSSSSAMENTDIIAHAVLNLSRWKEYFFDALYGPVRSHVSLLPTIFIYTICKRLHWDRRDIVATYAPYLIHGLVIVIPTDLAIAAIAATCESYIDESSLKSPTVPKRATSIRNWALFASLTNWFLAYALNRTYSNSIECMLLSVGVALVLSALHRVSMQLKEHNIHDKSRSINHNKMFYATSMSQILAKIAFAFFLGGLSVSMRFSSIAAWIPLGLITSIRLSTSSVWDNGFSLGRNKFLKSIGFCAAFGLSGLMLSCVIDRYYFGFWAVPFLGNFHFNVLLGHGSLYGTHPYYWYFLVGLPCICGSLLPFFLYEITVVATKYISTDQRQKNHWSQMIEDPFLVLVVIISSYVFLHSLSDHKEFRFILPIMPIICVLAGHAISQFEHNCDSLMENAVPVEHKMPRVSVLRRRRIIIAIFFILNYPPLFYLCRFHQRASIDVNRYISDYIFDKLTNQQIDYSIPSTSSTYNIHYFLGCHSTPLYSHLHIRPLNSTSHVSISAWTLDCSADCRSDPNMVCESDFFLLNPNDFFFNTYNRNEAILAITHDKVESCDDDKYMDTSLTLCASRQSNASKYGLSHKIIPDVIIIDGIALGSMTNPPSSMGFQENVFRQAEKCIQIINKKATLTEMDSKVCLGNFCLCIFFESIHVFLK